MSHNVGVQLGGRVLLGVSDSVLILRFIYIAQKYSRLRCLLRVKGLVFCFYLAEAGKHLKYIKKRKLFMEYQPIFFQNILVKIYFLIL